MKSLMLASVLISCLAAGCISSGTKVTEEQQAQFKVHVTTEAEVIAKLGPPNNVNKMPDGTKIDTYAHVEGSGSAANYIPIVNLFASSNSQTTDMASFTFDSKGILMNMSSGHGQSTTSSGLTNQQ